MASHSAAPPVPEERDAAAPCVRIGDVAQRLLRRQMLRRMSRGGAGDAHDMVQELARRSPEAIDARPGRDPQPDAERGA
ncbi:hypothetical protein ACFSUD_08770 [Sulfitobacter aestuarii]|uniref:Uncharacterized protein n=1 Tax=Sulfitobacter aestuarii TaxID=2161676 RepID=A0ABW5U409_9RHOB